MKTNNILFLTLIAIAGLSLVAIPQQAHAQLSVGEDMGGDIIGDSTKGMDEPLDLFSQNGGSSGPTSGGNSTPVSKPVQDAADKTIKDLKDKFPKISPNYSPTEFIKVTFPDDKITRFWFVDINGRSVKVDIENTYPAGGTPTEEIKNKRDYLAIVETEAKKLPKK